VVLDRETRRSIGQPLRIELATSLVVRESTAPPAAGR
jgi:hypothetical protein